jgi:glycosyltransferase involved in cell wall biosynthesis
MMEKVAFIVSTPMTARVFLAHQINVLAKLYDVTVVTNMIGNEEILDNLPANVQVFSLPIEREIRFGADLKALALLVRYFWVQQFFLIHSVSPKAGLLATVAGWITRTPNRLHTFTGQVWVTQTGVKRWLLKTIDKLIAGLATRVLVDSNSQRDFLVENCVVGEASTMVLGKGSISGVDLERFHPSQGVRESIRLELNIDQDALVLLFLGRLKIDKGVLDLAYAFSRINRDFPNTVLVVIGPDEENLQSEMIAACGDAASATRFVPFTKRPEDYMATSDIFVLPSYREGFGSVVIEAAACGVPAIVSRIYGLTDAVEEGVSGLFFEAGNIDDICATVKLLLSDKCVRTKLGNNALKRVQNQFSQEIVTNEVCTLYSSLISGKVENAS